MPDERYTFETARIRLEEIAAEVRKKDTSLEKSLDLLEEGVRLANICTELVDHTDLSATVTQEVPEPSSDEPETDVRGVDESEVADAGDADEPVAEIETVDDEDTESEVASPDADGAPDVDSASEMLDEPDAGAFDDTEEDLHEPPAPGGDG